MLWQVRRAEIGHLAYTKIGHLTSMQVELVEASIRPECSSPATEEDER
jgi:hypothetical protein